MCETKQISWCNFQILYCDCLARGSLKTIQKTMNCLVVKRFYFSPCARPPLLAGLLQGMYLRQSAGGARAEVHGWEKRGYSADGVGRPFPQAYSRAPTAVQLQLHGRHAGHLRRGWIPTVRQGLQGEWKGQRSRMQWSPDQTYLLLHESIRG